MHGEEQLKLYTEAFVEFDFRPFKRYKRFTHSLFLLVANFILAIMVDPLKERPEIMFFSMAMGVITSVLLVVDRRIPGTDQYPVEIHWNF